MNESQHNKLYNWLFLCHDGSYVYGQAPNIPIAIAGIAFILSIVIKDPALNSTIVLIFRLSVITWAILELAWGINNFRRILGAIVLLVVSVGVLMS